MGGVLTGAGFWGLLLVEGFGGVTTVEGGFVTVADGVCTAGVLVGTLSNTINVFLYEFCNWFRICCVAAGLNLSP